MPSSDRPPLPLSSQSNNTPNILKPIKVGTCTLQHRIALAPLTRYRANNAHVHGPLGVQYYSQRASVPGTLLISEATYVSQDAGGLDNIPGIYTDEQIAAWKKITDVVHSHGSFIFQQIWGLGRSASASSLHAENPAFSIISSSTLKLADHPPSDTPRPLTLPEIHAYFDKFAQAAANSIGKAGFDGVEVHAAYGYLLDQFTQDCCNKRTDEYGGDVAGRCRFVLGIVDAVVKAVGQEKVGIRISPWSRWQEMRMADPIPTFTYLVTTLRSTWPNLAYLSVVEPRICGPYDDFTSPPIDPTTNQPQIELNDFLREIWYPKPFLSAGYRSAGEVYRAGEGRWGDAEVVAMGRYFVSNPDLPRRIKEGIPWAPYDESTFYEKETPVGYVDYPTADMELATPGEL